MAIREMDLKQAGIKNDDVFGDNENFERGWELMVSL